MHQCGCAEPELGKTEAMSCCSLFLCEHNTCMLQMLSDRLCPLIVCVPDRLCPWSSVSLIVCVLDRLCPACIKTVYPVYSLCWLCCCSEHRRMTCVNVPSLHVPHSDVKWWDAPPVCTEPGLCVCRQHKFPGSRGKKKTCSRPRSEIAKQRAEQQDDIQGAGALLCRPTISLH